MPSIRADYSGIRSLGQRAAGALGAFAGDKRIVLLQAGGLVQTEIKKKIRRPGRGFGPLIAGKSNTLFSS